jgi:hypothetical protein
VGNEVREGGQGRRKKGSKQNRMWGNEVREGKRKEGGKEWMKDGRKERREEERKGRKRIMKEYEIKKKESVKMAIIEGDEGNETHTLTHTHTSTRTLAHAHKHRYTDLSTAMTVHHVSWRWIHFEKYRLSIHFLQIHAQLLK